MFSAWLDITARRHDEKKIFGCQSVRFPPTEFRPQTVLTRLDFNFASRAINSAAAESMSETQIDPGVSNFIQTPSVNNCILPGVCRGTIGETEVEPCGCIRRPTARQRLFCRHSARSTSSVRRGGRVPDGREREELS
jgi:hypothetical protein